MGDISKLPKWAQLELETLKKQVWALCEEVSSLRARLGIYGEVTVCKPVGYVYSNADCRGPDIDMYAMIATDSPSRRGTSMIRARIAAAGYVEVSATDGAVKVIPQASNVVLVTGDEFPVVGR